MARLALIVIGLYRMATAGKPRCCRYYPSCSEYAEEAVKRHGNMGIFAALMRIFRCNQLFPGGYDPVK